MIMTASSAAPGVVVSQDAAMPVRHGLFALAVHPTAPARRSATTPARRPAATLPTFTDPGPGVPPT